MVQGDVLREKGKHGCEVGYVDRREIWGVKTKGETARAGVLTVALHLSWKTSELPNKATTST